MTEHALKTWPEHFQAIASGDKTLELRRNDRDFQAGDTLHLREWDPAVESYSGHELLVRVTHVLPGGAFGLAEGFVALSIRPHVRALAREELVTALTESERGGQGDG